MTGTLDVRPATLDDLENIVAYFLNADHDFLAAMGVDISKLPSRKDWLNILKEDFKLSLNNKQFFYIIWLRDNEAIGHCNINKIIFGQEAYMHLHIWRTNARQKGIGMDLLKMTLPYYFQMFQLKALYCEPSASNPAPNRTLEKLGFEFVKSYDTVPGWINFHQTVIRWCMTKERFETLCE